MNQSVRSLLKKPHRTSKVGSGGLAKVPLMRNRSKEACRFCVNKDLLTLRERRDTSKGNELPVTEVSIKMWLVPQEFYRGDVKMDWRLVYDFKVPFCYKTVGLNK